jgi:hypothetical protein
MSWRTFVSTQPASSTTFITNAENSGGKAFRQSGPANAFFSCMVQIGDLQYSMYGPFITDKTKLYWTATYELDYMSGSNYVNKNLLFIGDFTSGAIEKVVTDVKDRPIDQPLEFALEQNFPNPFNPTTTIEFSLQEPSMVTLKVFDVLGQEAATIADEFMEHGVHRQVFDASHLSSGMYYYKIEAGKYSAVKKLMLLK